MEEEELIQVINNDMGLALPPRIPFSDLRLRLQAVINSMMEKDFLQLVNVLYRVDVNERKLKYLLQENVGEDAAIIIADLIIARQVEKIASRKQYNQHNDLVDDEEKW
jgi:hypothetical protein